MEIKRDIYLTQLINARQNGFIKVVTGPRRCGKSYLLMTLFHNHLLSEGVDEEHIIEVFTPELLIKSYISSFWMKFRNLVSLLMCLTV